jgi:hypothetical protein
MPSEKKDHPPLPEPHRRVLEAVYDFLGSDQSDGYLRVDAVPDLRSYYPNLGVVRASLAWLTNNGFLDYGVVGGHYRWSLSILGAETMHSFRLAQPLAPAPIHQTEIESEWSPLPLDRDSEAARVAISLTEELVERVRGENGFAVAEPERHSATIWSLQTGLDAIKTRRPSRSQIVTLLFTPMRWLSDKFAGAAIGELAKQALHALLTWIS